MDPVSVASDVQQAARDYIARGWQVVPLEPQSKACDIPDWPKIIFKPIDFGPTNNIGLRSTIGLVDIDCDAPEVIKMAPACRSNGLDRNGLTYSRENTESDFVRERGCAGFP